LSAAEALIKELRARLDDTANKLTSTQAELTTAQGHAEAATARAMAAVEAERAGRQARGRATGEGTLGAAQGGTPISRRATREARVSVRHPPRDADRRPIPAA
jgi:hypothetical protein